MIANFYGKYYTQDQLRNLIGMSPAGASLHGIRLAAKKIGFKTVAVKVSFDQLDEDVVLPCIAHWNQKHFVVIPPQNYSRRNAKNRIKIANPSVGMVKVDIHSFLKAWANSDDQTGIVLALEPTKAFYLKEPRELDLK
jgi:ATP-binding cassette subfamily B protein